MRSSSVIEISDSDSDASPPTSSQPATSVIDLLDSDDEHSMPSRSGSSLSQFHLRELTDSDDDELPPTFTLSASQSHKAKSKRKRDSDSDLEKERQKQEKAAQKAAEKRHKDAREAAKKDYQRRYKEENKLVSDKKTTLKDMEIVFPAIFAEPGKRPLYDTFRDRVAEYHMTVSLAQTREVRGLDVFSWTRTRRSEYNIATREWDPVDEYVVKEATAAVYLEAARLVTLLLVEKNGPDVASQLRKAFLHDHLQIFFIVNGMGAFIREQGMRAVDVKDQVERAVASLQMAEGIHFLYTESIPDAVERLYDLSADLGIKPYKIIERSHLPFCSDTEQRSGTSLADTWLKMLTQVHRLTPSMAEGIVEKFPTPRSLMEAFERAHTGAEIDGMVAGLRVERNVDGTMRKRDNGIDRGISSKVGTTLWGRDPLALVVRGTHK
ncbi:ERCC4 domain-containing protein [Mycena chlorophos]|uniref:ERCC4 domain-containing protein n=1 Tax=Mycena chlorophos TaxID=658473 RepID=A0A8H6TGC4_MYCCL|nr:ERCC4 domain-containing protein [Mycena chlorophos]